ncbi:hypothetical protein, partial [Paraburkholderia sediminicola]|uniref:hypothetical protein n=1 Tax=Paraburkholderia sediminicola TaxID=458836 RepID=UPI0038B8DEF4
MPAVKTRFQDMPVILDPVQRLEIAHQHFDVCALPVQQQLFAWCDRMIGVVDLLTTLDGRGQRSRLTEACTVLETIGHVFLTLASAL